MSIEKYEERAQAVLDGVVELTQGVPNNVKDVIFDMVKLYGKTYSPIIPNVIARLIKPE